MNRVSYSEFHFGFVLSSVFLALSGGFGFGAVLAWMIGFEVSMGDWWVAMLQAHGHVQLMGWAGLMIVGVSLHFLPRLAGTPLRFPGLASWICGLLAVGILLRAMAQPLVGEWASFLPQWGLGLSGMVEAVGVGCYLILILSTVLGAVRPALGSVRIYLLMAVCGWTFYAGINAVLVLQAAMGRESLVAIGWNRFAIGLFLDLVLLPVAMVFSIRTLPLYLRLPAPDWAIGWLGVIYLLAVLMEKLSMLGALLDVEPVGWIQGFGHLLKGGALLFLIWKLDVLLRFRAPWTVKRIGEPGPERRPTRPGLPDYGEFGQFERLLYGAYAWLVLGAGCEIVVGLGTLSGWVSPIDADALRHIYFMGFISFLIFGMAPRMIPGFMHKRQVAYPALVGVTFWLVGTAALFRIVPLLLAGILDEISYAVEGALVAFGLSGLLGWIAVGILGWNLWATWRLDDGRRDQK